MAIGPVTPARMESGDYYRAQINTDKEFWAFIYGALIHHYGQTKAGEIRDFPPMVKQVEADIDTYFQEKLIKDPAFRASIQGFISDKVGKAGKLPKTLAKKVGRARDSDSPELRKAAREFFMAHGWTPPGA